MSGDARLLIAGEWVDGPARLPVLDKFRLTTVGQVHIASREQVRRTVAAAHAAFRQSTLSSHERGCILDRAANLLEQRAAELVRVLRVEAGFPQVDARSEILRCAQTLRLSAEEARRICGEMVPLEGVSNQSGRLGFTLRVPLGVVCAITPFNAPLNTVAHKVGPALAAGNAVVLKPSPHAPTAVNIVAQVLLEAGLPPTMLSVVHGIAETARWLMEEPLIRFCAFTGSTEAGRAVQQLAGLRRTQMELGSIAFAVLCDDANLDAALPKIVSAGYRKAGQVCTSVQIVLVHRALAAVVEQRLSALVQALVYGDPADERTSVGPVISEAAAQRIERCIDAALAGGARCLVGGPRSGAVIPPALLTGIDDSMQVVRQEIFGPVMSIMPFDTLEQAIARINDMPFGLATGVFTDRLDDVLIAARRLDVGGVHFNETSSSRVDLMPYGGTKDSGFGREGPRYAIREMTEERMVTITSGRVQNTATAR